MDWFLYDSELHQEWFEQSKPVKRIETKLIRVETLKGLENFRHLNI